MESGASDNKSEEHAVPQSPKFLSADVPSLRTLVGMKRSVSEAGSNLLETTVSGGNTDLNFPHGAVKRRPIIF